MKRYKYYWWYTMTPRLENRLAIYCTYFSLERGYEWEHLVIACGAPL